MFVIVICICSVQFNAISLGRSITGVINGIVGIGQQSLRHVMRRTRNPYVKAALGPIARGRGPLLRQSRTRSRTRTGTIHFGDRGLLRISA